METIFKWAQRVSIAVLVVWLMWLTAMQIYLNNQVEPFTQSDMLKALVGYQQEMDYMEGQIQSLEASSTPSK